MSIKKELQDKTKEELIKKILRLEEELLEERLRQPDIHTCVERINNSPQYADTRYIIAPLNYL